MIICNITWSISPDTLSQWQQWFHEDFEPFLHRLQVKPLHFCKLLFLETSDLTFSQQLGLADLSAYNELMSLLQPKLKQLQEHMGTSVMYFQTVMEEVGPLDEFST
ncbi:MAG: DUF4286 family protein [Thermoflavifilum sp.]|nr:DUF4286 family protein [Thermoflavifilum sp.]